MKNTQTIYLQNIIYEILILFFFIFGCRLPIKKVKQAYLKTYLKKKHAFETFIFETL